MGLVAAKQMPKEKVIVLSGRTMSKMEKAVDELRELGYVIATAVDERIGYLAGVDILCDGGCTTGKKF